jgi:hypothetical protein
MEFILMVVVFASELPAEDTISQTDVFIVDERSKQPLNTQTQIQTKSDSLEKQ